MSRRSGEDLVRAAGGVVARDVDGRVEVLVVHRPRYDDWSFPKGKLDPGETFEDAAVREVAEESGVHAVLGDELLQVDYVDHRGRPKVVRYWTMVEARARAAGSGGPADIFEPNHEVDQIRWVGLDEVRSTLSYETDRAVLDAYLGRRRRT